jgi:hypothetical protein
MRSHLRAEQSLRAEVTTGEPKSPPRCRTEPIEEIRTLFVDEFQKVRIERGEKPAERAVFRKQHGAAKARLSVVGLVQAGFVSAFGPEGPLMHGSAGRATRPRIRRIRRTIRWASP